MSGIPAEDLSEREYLRASEVWRVFGIREAYLRAQTVKDPLMQKMVRRLPGERGVMLWNREDLRKWVEAHQGKDICQK